MMNLIRGIIGTLAVLFAAHSIANWSANTGKKELDKQVKITKGDAKASPDGEDCCTGPLCGG